MAAAWPGTCLYALRAHPGTPYRTLADLEAAAKAAPAVFKFATMGVGSLAHVSDTLLQQRSDFWLVRASYRDGDLALQGVLAGRVPLFMLSIVIVMPHDRSGGLRTLGVRSWRKIRFISGVKRSLNKTSRVSMC